MSSPLDRVRHAAGAILSDEGSLSGFSVVGETLQCVHCAKHWMMVPGSGHERGFCLNCQGPVCGGPLCWECVPQEQWLLNQEAAGQRVAQQALATAEKLSELVHLNTDRAFAILVEHQYQRHARIDANIRAIRGG